MPDLIPPHGGLERPVNRIVPEERRREFIAEAQELPAFPVSDADASSVYRIGDGALSPLTGPMVREVYERVLRDMVIMAGGRRYAWTIPIALPAARETAAGLKPGRRVRPVSYTHLTLPTIYSV